jgi:rhodanese-related sulfurtransferase
MYGFGGYGFKEIDAAGLQQMLQEKAVALIDVRGESEVAYGIIDGARHIPLHLLPLRAEELDKDTPTIFYCRTGARSAQACLFMASRGHGNVYNLQGGIMAWMQSGRDLAKVA